MYNQEIRRLLWGTVDNMLLHLRCLELLEVTTTSIDPNSPQRNALEGTGTITANGAKLVEVVLYAEQPNPWGTSTNGGPGGSGGGGAGQTILF